MSSIQGTAAIFLTPYTARFAVMNVTYVDGVLHFKPIPVTEYALSHYEITAMNLTTNGNLLGTYPCKTHDGTIARKQIRRWGSEITVRNKVTNEQLRVIRFADPYRILGQSMFVNPPLTHAQIVTTHSYVDISGNSVAVTADVSGHLFQSNNVPAKKKKITALEIAAKHAAAKHATATTTATTATATATAATSTATATALASAYLKGSSLNLFVAKQLLAFAQSKKELCPIVAEEFSSGHTAVMPCGHLFAQIAIEESFKKESRKCPSCRQIGTPTYV